jgi:quercetin dioxygenase-like cupin family protein
MEPLWPAEVFFVGFRLLKRLAEVTRMGRTALLLAALLAALPASALAQDAVSVAPNVYTKVLDNERVLVLEARLKPGAKVPLHSHPDHVIYMQTDGSIVLKLPGKTPYEMTLNAGEALFLTAQTRAEENDGNKEVRFLVVELKQSARPAAAAARGKKAAAKGKAKVKGKAKPKGKRKGGK